MHHNSSEICAYIMHWVLIPRYKKKHTHIRRKYLLCYMNFNPICDIHSYYLWMDVSEMYVYKYAKEFELEMLPLRNE